MKHLLLFIIASICSGCISSEGSSREVLVGVEDAWTERVRNTEEADLKHIEFEEQLEVDLLLNLWIYLGDQRHDLVEKLAIASPEEQAVLEKYITALQDQERQTWRAIFGGSDE